jgi:hypothetical protein
MKILIAFLTFALAGVVIGAEAAWTSDYQEGRRRASQSGQPLLVAFTGSDWCPSSRVLSEEVFGSEEFRAWAADRCVLVAVDCPSEAAEVPEHVKQANRILRWHYGVAAFPAVFLCDSSGRPVGCCDYQRDGVTACLKQLTDLSERLRKRDEAFAAARGAEGADRAACLERALRLIPEGLLAKAYRPEVDALAALRPSSDLVAAVRRIDGQERSGPRGANGVRVAVPVAAGPGKESGAKTGAREKPGGKRPDDDLTELTVVALEKSLNRARAEMKRANAGLAEQEERRKTLTADLGATRAELETLEKKLEAVRQRVAAREKEIAGTEKAASDLRAARERLTASIGAYQREFDRRAEIARLEDEARQLQKQAEALRKRAEALRKQGGVRGRE